LHTICCSRTMDLGLHIARKKSFLRHTVRLSRLLLKCLSDLRHSGPFCRAVGVQRPCGPRCSGGSQIYGTSSGWKGSQLLNQADTVLNQQVSYSYLPPVPAKYRRGSRRVRRASPSCLRASLVCVRKGRQEKVDRRNVHPYPLRVSGDIVPSGPRGFPNGTKPFASAPTIDLVRPLSLTEELRLCQNIEHYNYRYECRVPQASIHRHDARVPSTKIE
jgi:hypothetical protein